MQKRLGVLLTLVASMACQPGNQNPPMRFWTQDLAVRITANPTPPRAREATVFRVEVRDKESGQPIEGGEGRVYATSHDGASAWDGLTPAAQPGVYTARLSFITSGEWAMGLQFRRDSTQKIETMNDWRQQVAAARNEAP